MRFDFTFYLQSVLLGVGLAMDAFSVSLANGLNEPQMKVKKMNIIAGTFGFFQALMPMLGWVCVHTIVNVFSSLTKFIPWIALVLLLYIGIKMIVEGIKNRDGSVEAPAVGFAALMLQAVATSIDALSVGFTIADYDWKAALVGSLIICLTTYGICLAGLKIGKTAGTRLAGKANIVGGAILIAIGIEIWLKGIL